eukprot:COSAG02_NODE_13192_length_1429_cov_1.529323_1_plen_276_part_10
MIVQAAQNATRCAYAAAVEFQEAWYEPLEAREDALAAGTFQAAEVTVGLAVVGNLACDLADLATQATATNAGLSLSRDLCSGSPERHTPLRVAASVERVFAGTTVSVDVISGRSTLEEQYPLLAAVDRGSVPRHAGCVVKLRYTPDGASTSVNLQRSFLVGKGVAMDTGGVNLKGNGGGGMSRDKGGAAAVAGFMLSVATLKPKDHSFTAFLCMVRNSIGSNAYVPDEIIKTRAGTRVLVVNTDAEGRFSMADSLCEAKEMALSLPVAASPPQLWT